MPAITLERFFLTWSLISLRVLIVTSVYNIVVFVISPDQELWKLKTALASVILLHHGLRYAT